MADLIERLQYFSGWSTRDVPGIELGPQSRLAWDAIDEIERLQTALGYHVNELQEARRQAIRDATEIERLRAALTEMLADLDDPELIEISAATITRARQAAAPKQTGERE